MARPMIDPPSWYTPERLLGIFCWITFLVYLDRGVIACNGVNGSARTVDQPQGTGIQGEFNLTLFQDGVLPAAFMVGLLVASVIYSELCNFYNAFRLIGFGLAVWVAGSIGCGLAWDFWSLMVCRILMGVGEASIINLTGPFIDDVAPPAQKTFWFAILNLFPTVGIAGGYIFGGVVAPLTGWRVPFFIQAGVCIPMVLWTLFAPPVSLHMEDDESDMLLVSTDAEGNEVTLRREMRGLWGVLQRLQKDVLILCGHPVFLFNLFAYCPIQGAFGAYSYWGPRAGFELFGVAKEMIDMTFGVVTIFTSVIATLLGGAYLDCVGSSVKSGMLVQGWSALIGWVLIMGSFCMPKSFPAFMSVFAIGELAMFAGTAPSSAINIWTVPMRLRPLASSFNTVMTHLAGDVPTPPIVGWVQGKVGNWRYTMLGLTSIMLISVVLFLMGAYVPYIDYRPRDELVFLGDGDEGDDAEGAQPKADQSALRETNEATLATPLLQPSS